MVLIFHVEDHLVPQRLELGQAVRVYRGYRSLDRLDQVDVPGDFQRDCQERHVGWTCWQNTLDTTVTQRWPVAGPVIP